jgi:tRNA(fMet)-specific endonuclease VapC
MAVRFLLDTNMASYVLKGNFPTVRDRLLSVSMAEIGVSTVTEAELRFGLERKPQAAQLRFAVDEFLIHVEIVPWGSDAAKAYAKLRSAMEDSGTPMGNLDMMIAAQALAGDTTLVSHDRVFQRVRHLKLEDWTKP